MSKLRRQKLADRFRQLDGDHDGFVDRTDLQMRAERLGDELVPADKPDARQLILDGYEQLWQLLSQADADHDGKVSQDEYAEALASGVLSDPQAFHRCVAVIATGLFRALDHDGDDRIGMDELRRMASLYGVPLREVESFFVQADGAERGMNQVTFLAAVEDYYYSDHRDSPVGKAIFSMAVA